VRVAVLEFEALEPERSGKNHESNENDHVEMRAGQAYDVVNLSQLRYLVLS
jgi:hypothetical protein